MSPHTVPRGLRRVVVASLLTASLALAGCTGTETGENPAASTASPTAAGSEVAGESTGTDTAEPSANADAGASPTSAGDGDVGGSGADGAREGESSAPVTVTTAAEPTAVGEFEYEDVPEPAPQELQTLCDLTQEYFQGRREASLVDGQIGEGMQLTVVALSDQVGIWTGLQDQYPGAAEDIRRAEVILQHWDNALAASQQGLADEEAAYLSEADVLIEQLPTQAAVEGVGCGE
ncbi:hypothetical protein [uncultured Serinicoccus sp.]|uniref:hypothetical protein n=1 Tax=uncultured Serinicoccus sp. TaxID=735514 RepID=UPI00261DB112|nr:hypothetical protein [uncultured Serinicoccus sp.]